MSSHKKIDSDNFTLVQHRKRPNRKYRQSQSSNRDTERQSGNENNNIKYIASSSKYTRGTRFDRSRKTKVKHTRNKKTTVEKPKEKEEPWIPKPSPPGSWAAIVAKALKEDEDEDGYEDGYEYEYEYE